MPQPEESTNSSQLMPCPKCQAAIKRTAKFCRHCGSALTANVGPVPVAHAAPNQEPVLRAHEKTQADSSLDNGPFPTTEPLTPTMPQSDLPTESLGSDRTASFTPKAEASPPRQRAFPQGLKPKLIWIGAVVIIAIVLLAWSFVALNHKQQEAFVRTPAAQTSAPTTRPGQLAPQTSAPAGQQVIDSRVGPAQRIPYTPAGYVNDFAYLLTPTTKDRIEQIAADLDRQQVAQLAVVTIPSIGDRSVEDYATNLFAQWGIGKKGKDDGLLLLIAKNERMIRIEVGYGLGGKVPNAIANDIIQAVRDKFRQGDFDGGLLTGARMLASAAGGR